MSGEHEDHDSGEGCPNCGGEGWVGGCFESCCSCLGDPEDPWDCCSPMPCGWCNSGGKRALGEGR